MSLSKPLRHPKKSDIGRVGCHGLSGAVWCCLGLSVLSGTVWCCLVLPVLSGAVCCCLVLSGAVWCSQCYLVLLVLSMLSILSALSGAISVVWCCLVQSGAARCCQSCLVLLGAVNSVSRTCSDSRVMTMTQSDNRNKLFFS